MVTLTRTGNGFVTLACVAGLLVAGAACNGILGIDSATVDPTFTPDAGAPSQQCQTYCTTVLKNCGTAEYNDQAGCLALCAALDVGSPSDTTQDSVGCRTHYAGIATGPTDSTNCRAAGPLGGGVCGTNLCANFCQLDTFACTGPNSEYDGGLGGCVGTCLANFNVYLTDAGNDMSFSTGNSLNCRIWHLEAAVDPGLEGPNSLKTHCPHTAIAAVSGVCE
jgi:hypothetical protein